MVREVICLCLQQQTAENDHAPYGALLYILPKAAWPSRAVRPSGTRPHGRQRQRVIAARLQRILQGQAHELLTELCDEARTLPLPEVADNDVAELTEDILTQQQANAILRKMNQGQQSLSLKSLTPSQLAPATDRNWQKAWKKLQPAGDNPLPSPAAAPTWKPEASHWKEAMQRFHKEKHLIQEDGAMRCFRPLPRCTTNLGGCGFSSCR